MQPHREHDDSPEPTGRRGSLRTVHAVGTMIVVMVVLHLTVVIVALHLTGVIHGH